MPSLTIKTPDGKTRSVSILKRITSLGKSADNDIVLEDTRVPETAFAIMFDGISYKVKKVEDFRRFVVNVVIAFGNHEAFAVVRFARKLKKII